MNFYFLRCNQCCQPQSDWWLAGQKVVEWPEALHVLWDLLHLWPECGESLPGRWEGCRKSGDELNDGLEYRVLFWLDVYRSGTIFVIDSLIWIWGLHHWEIGVGILDFVILVRVGCVMWIPSGYKGQVVIDNELIDKNQLQKPKSWCDFKITTRDTAIPICVQTHP